MSTKMRFVRNDLIIIIISRTTDFDFKIDIKLLY